MRKIAAITAVSALALFASPAAAQVVPGPRVEILGGWDNVKVKTSEFDGALDFLPENNLSDEALVYGVGAGYDFGLGGVAIGADLEFTKSQTELVVTDEDAFRYRAKGGRDLYVGARATFAVSNSINFYLKGGYSRFRTQQSVYDVSDDPADPVLLGRDNKTFGGWRVGAGMHFTNGMFYAGPEYRYTRYEDGLRRHQLVAVAGLKFGPRVEVAPPPPVVEAPPPPPPPPATQTCPDGSVILATEVCPAPPPPPPPPPPAPERG